MRRLAAVVAVAAAALAGAWLLHGLYADRGAPQHGWTLAQIEPELMCPTCNLRLDLSHSAVADRIRTIVEQERVDGWSKSRVEANLAAQFPGRQVLAQPSGRDRLLAWLVPALALLGGALVIGLLTRSWLRTRPLAAPSPSPPLSAEERQRLERVLDAELGRAE
jgi:cytochrome c-type biogenesis protein CcmH/NrfF